MMSYINRYIYSNTCLAFKKISFKKTYHSLSSKGIGLKTMSEDCIRKLRRQEKVHFTSGLNNYFYQNIYSTNFYIYQKNTDYIQYQSSIRCYYTLHIFARGDTGQWCQIVGKALSVMTDRWLVLPFWSGVLITFTRDSD